MSMVKLLYVAWFTLWKVLAVAGVFLLVLVPPPPLPPTAMMKTKPCNIKSSSIARRIIHQTLMPIVTSFSPEVKLPYQCPLHPVRDVHARAEMTKLNYRVNLWTCAQCGKSFTGEHDLERHIYQRHPELSDSSDFSVCLADFCDVLRCDPQRDRSIRKPWPVRQAANKIESSQQLARAPSQELVSLLENTETDLILGLGYSCAPGHCLDLDIADGDSLLTLEMGAPRLRRHGVTDRSNGSKDFYHQRKTCNSNNMEKLKLKCQMLVDSCISPLALNLTDKELEELRLKIEKELCDYLTCDKYWSVDKSKHSLNIGAVILITLTLAILYLVFVYQLVWVWY